MIFACLKARVGKVRHYRVIFSIKFWQNVLINLLLIDEMMRVYLKAVDFEQVLQFFMFTGIR